MFINMIFISWPTIILPHKNFHWFVNANLSQSSQVEIVYKAGDGVSPRQKIRQSLAVSPSPATNPSPSNGTPKKSPSSSSINKLHVKTPVDRSLTPSRQSQSKDLPKSASPTTAADSNKLSGISSTRSITDTASSVLNTKLDEGRIVELEKPDFYKTVLPWLNET